MKHYARFRRFDKPLFIAPILIFLIGILSIYSASFKSSSSAHELLVFKQMLWMGVGMLLVFLCVRVDYFRFLDWIPPFYIFSLMRTLD